MVCGYKPAIGWHSLHPLCFLPVSISKIPFATRKKLQKCNLHPGNRKFWLRSGSCNAKQLFFMENNYFNHSIRFPLCKQRPPDTICRCTIAASWAQCHAWWLWLEGLFQNFRRTIGAAQGVKFLCVLLGALWFQGFHVCIQYVRCHIRPIKLKLHFERKVKTVSLFLFITLWPVFLIKWIYITFI